MLSKLVKLYKASLELNKHKAEINRYNKAWAKIKEEQKESKELKE